jgi:hypothetical protein
MAGEAQILEESSPQRHRDHRDDLTFTEEDRFDFILRALCVSVVKIRAKQSQFPGGLNECKSFMAKWLREFCQFFGHVKQSQFPLRPMPHDAWFGRACLEDC